MVEAVPPVATGNALTCCRARSGLVAVVVCGLALAACGSHDSPSAPTPPPPPPDTSQFPFATSGRVIDSLTQAPAANVSVMGDGLVGASTDANGAFTVRASVASPDPRLLVFSSSAFVERRTQARVSGGDITVSLIDKTFDLKAFDQMFRTSMLLRWTTAPPLLVETRAVQFTSTTASDQTAIGDQMTDAEYDQLIADLTWALPQLTGQTFGHYATVTKQTSNEGATVHLLNSGTITVVREEGLTAATGFWGYSRWQYLNDGTVVGGVVTLDNTFEHSGSSFRRSLRSHELGHALGYNHVTTRASVMNTSAVFEPNAWDQDACRIAFQRPPGNRSPDTDPSSWSANLRGEPSMWSPPVR